MLLRPLRTLLATTALTLALPLAAAPAEPGAHAELALTGSAGSQLGMGALPGLQALVQQPGFLDTPGAGSPHPLAPCALLGAALGATTLNLVFAGLSSPGSVAIMPPVGSHLLGPYDALMERASGRIRQQDAGKTAAVVARLLIWHSWRASGMANEMIATRSQRECLAILTDPAAREQALQRLSGRFPQPHTTAASTWIAAYTQDEAMPHLAALEQPGFLDGRSQTARNPFSPCALLGGLRLAARLNETYNGALIHGRFDASGRAELRAMAQELGSGQALRQGTPRTAELLAAVFAAETARARDLNALLLRGASERQCLGEIFQPGQLRARLRSQGVDLPLR